MGFLVRNKLLTAILIFLLAGTTEPSNVFAKADVTVLAKEEQNPISTTTQIGLKFFSYSGAGVNGDQNPGLLNVHFSLPYKWNKDWNLITQANMPFISWQYGAQRFTGAGNLQLQMYFSPRKSSTIWGIGPAFQLPTATNPIFDNGQLATGPAFAVVNSQGRWVNAIQGSHLWKIGGSNNKSAINLSLVQMAVNYNLKRGWALNFGTGISVDWSIQQGERSVVPISLAISHTVLPRRGGQPLTWNVGISYNALRPEGFPRLQYKAQLTFLFPQRTVDTPQRQE